MSEIIVEKTLSREQIFQVLIKRLRLKVETVIRLDGILYVRVRSKDSNKFEYVDSTKGNVIDIVRNGDDKKNIVTKFASIEAMKRYIKIYSSDKRKLKYELTTKGFVIYTSDKER
jgi:hypothetical protein